MADIRVEFTLEILPERVQRLVDSAEGPVGQRIRTAAEALLADSRPRIGSRYSGHHGPRLRDSGTVENIGGAAHIVRYNHPIAFLHHQGAQPHGISPKKPRGMGRSGPGVVTSSGATKFWTRASVSHPGSPANPYLTDSARALGLKPSGGLRRGTRLTPIFRSKGFF